MPALLGWVQGSPRHEGFHALIEAAFLEAHQTLQKSALLAGISRTYRPKDEEGEQFPPEATRVQVKAGEIIRKTTDELTKLFDVVATKDWANCTAKADVRCQWDPIALAGPCNVSLVH